MIRYADIDESMRHFATGKPSERAETVVYTHDSGLISDHNMDCYVCHERPAMLTQVQDQFGAAFRQSFQPCKECQRQGWELRQKTARPWWAFWRQ